MEWQDIRWAVVLLPSPSLDTSRRTLAKCIPEARGRSATFMARHVNGARYLSSTNACLQVLEPLRIAFVSHNGEAYSTWAEIEYLSAAGEAIVYVKTGHMSRMRPIKGVFNGASCARPRAVTTCPVRGQL